MFVARSLAVEFSTARRRPKEGEHPFRHLGVCRVPRTEPWSYECHLRTGRDVRVVHLRQVKSSVRVFRAAV